MNPTTPSTNQWADLLATFSGNKPLQIGIDGKSALVLGICIVLAVTVGVFVGTKAAKL